MGHLRGDTYVEEGRRKGYMFAVVIRRTNNGGRKPPNLSHKHTDTILMSRLVRHAIQSQTKHEPSPLKPNEVPLLAYLGRQRLPIPFLLSNRWWFTVFQASVRAKRKGSEGRIRSIVNIFLLSSLFLPLPYPPARESRRKGSHQQQKH